jgi:hypothetical protein
MSATVIVGAAEGKNPTAYPCQVSVNGGAQQNVTVIVLATTVAAIPDTELQAYLEARAMLAVGDDADAAETVTPYATGEAGPPDTRNWAALWLAGQIPS